MISATFITWTEAVEAATSAASRTPCGGSNPTEGAYPAVLTYAVRGHVGRGFTLVEVLVVIAIAVALSAIVVPIYQSYMDEVRLSNARKDIALISLCASCSQMFAVSRRSAGRCPPVRSSAC